MIGFRFGFPTMVAFNFWKLYEISTLVWFHQDLFADPFEDDAFRNQPFPRVLNSTDLRRSN